METLYTCSGCRFSTPFSDVITEHLLTACPRHSGTCLTTQRPSSADRCPDQTTPTAMGGTGGGRGGNNDSSGSSHDSASHISISRSKSKSISNIIISNNNSSSSISSSKNKINNSNSSRQSSNSSRNKSVSNNNSSSSRNTTSSDNSSNNSNNNNGSNNGDRGDNIMSGNNGLSSANLEGGRRSKSTTKHADPSECIVIDECHVSEDEQVNRGLKRKTGDVGAQTVVIGGSGEAEKPRRKKDCAKGKSANGERNNDASDHPLCYQDENKLIRTTAIRADSPSSRDSMTGRTQVITAGVPAREQENSTAGVTTKKQENSIDEKVNSDNRDSEEVKERNKSQTATLKIKPWKSEGVKGRKLLKSKVVKQKKCDKSVKGTMKHIVAGNKAGKSPDKKRHSVDLVSNRKWKDVKSVSGVCSYIESVHTPTVKNIHVPRRSVFNFASDDEPKQETNMVLRTAKVPMARSHPFWDDVDDVRQDATAEMANIEDSTMMDKDAQDVFIVDYNPPKTCKEKTNCHLDYNKENAETQRCNTSSVAIASANTNNTIPQETMANETPKKDSVRTLFNAIWDCSREGMGNKKVKDGKSDVTVLDQESDDDMSICSSTIQSHGSIDSGSWDNGKQGKPTESSNGRIHQYEKDHISKDGNVNSSESTTIGESVHTTKPAGEEVHYTENLHDSDCLSARVYHAYVPLNDVTKDASSRLWQKQNVMQCKKTTLKMQSNHNNKYNLKRKRKATQKTCCRQEHRPEKSPYAVPITKASSSKNSIVLPESEMTSKEWDVDKEAGESKREKQCRSGEEQEKTPTSCDQRIQHLFKSFDMLYSPRVMVVDIVKETPPWIVPIDRGRTKYIVDEDCRRSNDTSNSNQEIQKTKKAMNIDDNKRGLLPQNPLTNMNHDNPNGKESQSYRPTIIQEVSSLDTRRISDNITTANISINGIVPCGIVPKYRKKNKKSLYNGTGVDTSRSRSQIHGTLNSRGQSCSKRSTQLEMPILVARKRQDNGISGGKDTNANIPHSNVNVRTENMLKPSEKAFGTQEITNDEHVVFRKQRDMEMKIATVRKDPSAPHHVLENDDRGYGNNACRSSLHATAKRQRTMAENDVHSDDYPQNESPSNSKSTSHERSPSQMVTLSQIESPSHSKSHSQTEPPSKTEQQTQSSSQTESQSKTESPSQPKSHSQTTESQSKTETPSLTESSSQTQSTSLPLSSSRAQSASGRNSGVDDQVTSTNSIEEVDPDSSDTTSDKSISEDMLILKEILAISNDSVRGGDDSYTFSVPARLLEPEDGHNGPVNPGIRSQTSVTNSKVHMPQVDDIAPLGMNESVARTVPSPDYSDMIVNKTTETPNSHVRTVDISFALNCPQGAASKSASSPETDCQMRTTEKVDNLVSSTTANTDGQVAKPSKMNVGNTFPDKIEIDLCPRHTVQVSQANGNDTIVFHIHTGTRPAAAGRLSEHGGTLKSTFGGSPCAPSDSFVITFPPSRLVRGLPAKIVNIHLVYFTNNMMKTVARCRHAVPGSSTNDGVTTNCALQNGDDTQDAQAPDKSSSLSKPVDIDGPMHKPSSYIHCNSDAIHRNKERSDRHVAKVTPMSSGMPIASQLSSEMERPTPTSSEGNSILSSPLRQRNSMRPPTNTSATTANLDSNPAAVIYSTSNANSAIPSVATPEPVRLSISSSIFDAITRPPFYAFPSPPCTKSQMTAPSQSEVLPSLTSPTCGKYRQFQVPRRSLPLPTNGRIAANSHSTNSSMGLPSTSGGDIVKCNQPQTPTTSLDGTSHTNACETQHDKPATCSTSTRNHVEELSEDSITPTKSQTMNDSPTMISVDSGTPTKCLTMYETPIMTSVGSSTPTRHQTVYDSLTKTSVDSGTPTKPQSMYDTPRVTSVDSGTAKKSQTMNDSATITSMVDCNLSRLAAFTSSFSSPSTPYMSPRPYDNITITTPSNAHILQAPTSNSNNGSQNISTQSKHWQWHRPVHRYSPQDNVQTIWNPAMPSNRHTIICPPARPCKNSVPAVRSHDGEQNAHITIKEEPTGNARPDAVKTACQWATRADCQEALKADCPGARKAGVLNIDCHGKDKTQRNWFEELISTRNCVTPGMLPLDLSLPRQSSTYHVGGGGTGWVTRRGGGEMGDEAVLDLSCKKVCG